MSFLVNPYRGAAGGRPPSALGNGTFWLDNDVSKLYTGSTGDSGVQVASDGDLIGFAICDSASTRSWLRNVLNGTRPIWKVNIVNGNPVWRFQGSLTCFGNIGTRSAQTQPATSTLSDILGSHDYTFAAAILPRAFATTTATTNRWLRDGVFGDNASFQGLFYTSVDGSNYRVTNYAWDGSQKNAEIDLPKGVWAVIGGKHEGGNVKIRVNGGAWTSTACGNISTITNVQNAGKAAGSTGVSGQFDTVGIATYNAVLSDGDLLDVERYFGAKVGLSF